MSYPAAANKDFANVGLYSYGSRLESYPKVSVVNAVVTPGVPYPSRILSMILSLGIR